MFLNIKVKRAKLKGFVITYGPSSRLLTMLDVKTYCIGNLRGEKVQENKDFVESYLRDNFQIGIGFEKGCCGVLIFDTKKKALEILDWVDSIAMMNNLIQKGG